MTRHSRGPPRRHAAPTGRRNHRCTPCPLQATWGDAHQQAGRATGRSTVGWRPAPSPHAGSAARLRPGRHGPEGRRGQRQHGRRRPGPGLRHASAHHHRHRRAAVAAARAGGGHGDHRRRHRRHGRGGPGRRARDGARPARGPLGQPLPAAVRDARHLFHLHAADARAAGRAAHGRAAAGQPPDDGAAEPGAAHRPHRGAARTRLGAARRRCLFRRHQPGDQELGPDGRHPRGVAPRVLRHHAGLAAPRRHPGLGRCLGLVQPDRHRRLPPPGGSRCADAQRRRLRHPRLAGAGAAGHGWTRHRWRPGGGPRALAVPLHAAAAEEPGDRRRHRVRTRPRGPRRHRPRGGHAGLVGAAVHRALGAVGAGQPHALRAAHSRTAAAVPAGHALSHRQLP